jgi:hypothetical protein
MRYSAQIVVDYRQYVRQFGAAIDIKEFVDLFWVTVTWVTVTVY